MENKRTNAFSLCRRVGTTNYTVRASFSELAQETFEDKVLRIIKNEGLASPANCDTIGLSQMSRQSERSAL